MTLPAKKSNVKWEKWAHALLTSTCLSVVGGAAASATSIIVVEGTNPAPSDFGNSQVGAYGLGVGTNIVQGQLHSGTDQDDWFEFSYLLPGSTYTLLGTYNPLGQERGVSFQVFNSSGGQLNSATLEGQGGSVSGSTPSDGNLFVDVNFAEFGNPTYQMAWTGTLGTPEPASGLGAGLAAAAAAVAWRRKRARA